MRVSMQGQEVGARPLIFSDATPYAEAHVSLHGRVVGVGFEEFLFAYDERLGLNLRILQVTANSLEFSISGKPELLDMLFTVCWLGPGEAMVDDVATRFVLLNDVSGDPISDSS